MKKVFCAVLLTLTTIVAVAQSQPASQSGQPQPKQIKDQGEYNAYISALNTQDPAQKAAAMEAFVKQYPQSVVVTDALEQAMGAYQLANNTSKVEEMAKRLLQLEPKQIQAVAVVVTLDRVKATQGNKDALTDSCAYAQTGLQQLPTWQKPETLSDADFSKLKDQMTQIFNGASGFCALQKKDFAAARNFYLKAVQNGPNDFQNTYQLALSYLEQDPIDLLGFWYGAKALQLVANDRGTVNAIAPYFKAKFKKYHGGKPEDWGTFAATAASQTAPPTQEELAKLIPPAPTPCDFAVQAARENKPEDLSFSDKEFILSKANCSPANKEAADKIWQSIQDLQKGGTARLEIPVKVISATKETVEAAISDDNMAANKSDVHIVLEKPVLKPPEQGTTTRIVGVITKYTPEPFMFTMEQATLPAKAAPGKRPVHHAANRKPPR